MEKKIVQTSTSNYFPADMPTWQFCDLQDLGDSDKQRDTDPFKTIQPKFTLKSGKLL